MERAKRFELSTLTLARLCSTPELRPHRLDEASDINYAHYPQEENAIFDIFFAPFDGILGELRKTR